MVPFVKHFIVDQSMAASFSSHEMAAEYYRPGFSIHLVYTGAPVGSLKLQASNDGATWEDVASSTVAVSAASSTLYNLADQYYRLVRVVYTRTSGTGTINGYFY